MHDTDALSASRARFRAIHQSLRERICLLQYPPGTQLSEAELAAEFGVSRTPLRRVLAHLEFEGLVESRQGVGTLVTTVEPAELRQIFAFRMHLAELLGALDPVPPPPDDLARLDDLHGRCRALAAAWDPQEFARLNMGFQRALSGITGNAPLRETAERLYYRTARIWLQLVPEMDWSEEIDNFAREIAEVREALALGDLRAVGLIRRNHISQSLLRMSRHLDEARGD